MRILGFGIQSVGFYVHNWGEFVNVKIDEVFSKLGLDIQFGPAYSPWINGINKRNYASAAITIKKLLEDKKV